MIKIDIKDEVEYSRLRNGYLERISKYVRFNKEDIVPEEVSEKSKSDKSEKEDISEIENLTKETAEELKNKYTNLYNYLFDKGADEVNKEKLRCLLAGPEEMPRSFGGNGEKQTMLECLDEINLACPMPEEAEKKREARECCQTIFNYDKFVREQDDAYWLLRNLHVRVCPYCNQIYTVTLPSPEELNEEEEFKTTRATFDHFYSKSEHPYLAVSLFNLIPSCGVCNGNKSDKKEKIVYPYDQEFGRDAVFRVIPDFSQEALKKEGNILNFLCGQSDSFHIKFMGKEDLYLGSKVSLEERLSGIEDAELRERIIASISKFKLEEIYKEHKQEIRDILRNRYYFDEHYVKTVICPMLRAKMGVDSKKNLDEDNIERMAMDMLFFSNIRVEEWGQRPLNKLVSDILEQLTEL